MSLISKIDRQQNILDSLVLSTNELGELSYCRNLLTGCILTGGILGALGGYILATGPNCSSKHRMFCSLALGFSGIMLGGAFGVQTAMHRLTSLDSPLGTELNNLEDLKRRLRREGLNLDSRFSGDQVDEERARLMSIFNKRVSK